MMCFRQLGVSVPFRALWVGVSFLFKFAPELSVAI